MEAVVALYSAENHRHRPLSVSPHGGKPVKSSPRYRAHHSFSPGAFSGPSGSFSHPANGAGDLLNAQKQPPLLPLPIPMPRCQAVSSYPPPGIAKPIKPHRLTRHQSLNPNKPLIGRRGSDVKVAGVGPVPASGPRGPDPNKLPKDISFSKFVNTSVPLGLPELGTFRGSVFELAPPPSSLPLPRFSLRPKMRCNPEAGADTGATEGLRRMLRLP